MKKIILVSLLALSALVMAGCVMVYKTSDINRMVRDFDRNVENITPKVTSDFAEKKGWSEMLLAETSDKNLPPYPEMVTLVAEMEKVLSNFSEKKSEWEITGREMTGLTANKKQIRSDRPEYAKFKQLEVKSKQLSEALQNSANRYGELSNKLVKLFNNNGVTVVKSVDFISAFDKSLLQFDSGLQAARQQISDARQKNSGISSADLENEINVFEAKLAETVAKREELVSAYSQLKNALNGKEIVMIGPGLESARLKLDLETKIGELRAISTSARLEKKK
jgi:hypothetical protein